MNKAETEGTPHRIRSTGRRYEHLDMIRGLAAFAVLIGHVRGFVFTDFGTVSSGRMLAAPFYFVTGLGHQAVIIFFALSGFLVGGSAIREIYRRGWNAADYAVHRFTRLWTTLAPALVLTALFDFTGRDLLHLRGYGGEYWSMLSSGPFAQTPASLSPVTFLGNLGFLETIAVPVFGTNGPLWSLANEFWYYFLIPFAWVALRGGVRLAWRIAAGCFALLAALLLPRELLLLGSIWIFGALAFFGVPWVRSQSVARRRVLMGLTLLLTCLGLAVSIARPSVASDVGLGLCWAALLPGLAATPGIGGLYGRTAFALSEVSFTLYVVHFPLIALLWFWLVAPVQFPLGAVGLCLWLGLILAALAVATAMWWLFERNTGRIRRRVHGWLIGPSR